MPVVPGVLSLESLFEAARRLLAVTHPGKSGWRVVRVESVRFRKAATPGANLEFEVTAKEPPHCFAGVALLDGRPAVEADFELRAFG